MKIVLRILILTLSLSAVSFGNNHLPLHFTTIDISHGLSQNSVMTIARDKHGFMWFGTEDGLNRYDGVTFKPFRHIPSDSSSLNSNSIYSSLVDQNGNLWIGTYVPGVNKYVDSTETFIHYEYDPQNSLSISNGSVTALVEDNDGYIWTATSGEGLFRLDPITGIFVPATDLITNDKALKSDVLYSLFLDHAQNLWISTLDGLSVIDLKTYALKSYYYDKDDPSSLYDNDVNFVCETFDGENYQIWVGTNWGGLDVFDPETEGFIHLGFQSEVNPDFPETSVNNIIQFDESTLWVGTDSKGILVLDIKGNLQKVIGKKVYDDISLNDDLIQSFYAHGEMIWVGTAGGGVSKYNHTRKQFHSFSYDPLNPNGLHDNRILRIESDSQGNLWIATWSEGLTFFNNSTGVFTVYNHDPGNPYSVSDNGIQDILVDSNDNLWVISANRNLDFLRKGSTKFKHIPPSPDNPKGLGTEYLLCLAEDAKGNILLGSWQEGLYRLDPASMDFEKLSAPAVNGVSLGSISYYCMFEDSKGTIWIGAENEGLIRYDQKNQTIQQYKTSLSDPHSLPNNDVMCFYEDEEGYIWLGTYGGGLSRFDPKRQTFQNLSVEDGLPSNSIYSLFPDDHGALWMSTNNGLAKYHPTKNILKTYDISDGVLSREFNPGGCQLDDGWIYFGGVKGITYFHPDEIRENTNTPPVIFTELSIMTTPISIGDLYNDRVVLPKAMTTLPTLVLHPEDVFFNISFASLDYYYPKNNSYAYYLEGFDDNWRKIGHQRSVTFSNIPPGKYTLHIKGSNNDQRWNKEATSMDLIIMPEFYETWWFILSCIFLFFIIIFIVYKLRTNFLIKRGQELEKHNMQLNALIESRRKAHVKASERANYFRAVISQSPIPMAIHNSEGNITQLNAEWVELWGAGSPEEIIRDYHVEEDKLANELSLNKSFRKAVEGNIIEIPEATFTAHDGNTKVVQMLLYPLKNIVGMTNQVMVSIDDVTEIVRQRRLLEKSIVEKDLLLKEVHHRVKNNLQLVASLLGLQKAGTNNDKTMQTLDDIKNRVNSMALVHDALYRSPELDNIDISSYFQDLTDTLHAAFGQRAVSIKIVTKIPEITLPVDIAVPCGLMINEMVTNALKYAFPEPPPKDSHIIIQFTEIEDNNLRLEVIDNGVGLQKPVVWDSVDSLGLYLLKILSEHQLMGTVQLKDAPGAHFVIDFPIHPNFDD